MGKKWLAVMALAGACAVLGGCGQKAEETTAAAAATEAATEAAAAEDTTAAEAEAGGEEAAAAGDLTIGVTNAGQPERLCAVFHLRYV